MNQEQALAFQSKIEKLCENAGVWIETTYVNKPQLKDVIITISIKIKE